MSNSRTSAFAGQRMMLLASSMLLLVGCSDTPAGNWHSKKGWNAEDYFTDPQVIALCKAIEADDLDEIERLVKAGADVNAKGKGNMTPLLWAFPDNKLERFKKLLELGADPNVIVESDFNTKGAIHSGHSVTHMAATTKYASYFEEVMKHGGDSNLLDADWNDTLLHAITQRAPPADKKTRIQLVLDKGVNLNHLNHSDKTAAMIAVTSGGRYDIALMLIDAGADTQVYQPLWNKKLIHFVAMEERQHPKMNAESKAAYDKLVQRLEEQGDSIEEARRDLDRWDQWIKGKSIAEIKVLREMEIADRIAREKAEAETKQNVE